MLKIGLTGGIGSGKSLISKVFESLGASVYKADLAARQLMESDPKLINSILQLFGTNAYKDGVLQRKYLGDIVFSDPSKLKELNSLVHPAVHADFQNWCLQFIHLPYVIEEAAILFESGGDKNMDYVVFVKAALETRIIRTMQRDGIAREDVMKRIRQQSEDRIKEKRADFVINNENDSMILPQIVDLHQTFIKLNS